MSENQGREVVAGLGRGHGGGQKQESVAMLKAVSRLCVWFPVMTDCAGLSSISLSLLWRLPASLALHCTPA